MLSANQKARKEEIKHELKPLWDMKNRLQKEIDQLMEVDIYKLEKEYEQLIEEDLMTGEQEPKYSDEDIDNMVDTLREQKAEEND